MDSSIRRRSLRTWSLTAQMVALAIGVPIFVILAVAALFIYVEHGFVLVVIAAVLLISTVRAIANARRDADPGAELTDAGEPALRAMVGRLCALIDIPEPELRLSGSRQANSWVIHRPGRRPRLYVTGALLELLTPDELQAVIAHELTHIANRDAQVMTVISLPGAVVMRVSGGIWALPMIGIGFVANLGTSMLSRCRELTADAGSAAITGRPSALASALMKVAGSQTGIPDRDLRAAVALNAFNLVAVPFAHRGWRGGILVGRGPFATHPQLEARLRRLAALEREQQRTPAH